MSGDEKVTLERQQKSIERAQEIEESFVYQNNNNVQFVRHKQWTFIDPDYQAIQKDANEEAMSDNVMLIDEES